MKKLFVRYFKNKNDQIPSDSNMVCVDNCGAYEMVCAMKAAAVNTIAWLRTYPDGKTDFVWL